MEASQAVTACIHMACIPTASIHKLLVMMVGSTCIVMWSLFLFFCYFVIFLG